MVHVRQVCRNERYAVADGLSMPELGVPGLDLAIAINGASKIYHGWRPLWVPAVFIVPHPLDAYRNLEKFRQQCGIRGAVFETVAPIATGAIDVDDTDILRLKL